VSATDDLSQENAPAAAGEGAPKSPAAGDGAQSAAGSLLAGKRKRTAAPLATHLGIVSYWDLALFLVAKAEFKNDFSLFMKSTLDSVLRLSRAWLVSENPMINMDIALSRDSPLEKLLELQWGGWHRVPIVTSGRLDALITQSDVARYFALNGALVLGKAMLSQTLADLNIGTRYSADSMVCFTTDSAATCLERCVQLRVSAVAIVDKSNGSLVANFSCSDLRYLDETGFTALLTLNVLDFLRRYSSSEERKLYIEREGVPRFASAHTCLLRDSLEAVLFKIVALRVHRLYIVSENGAAVGVLSLTDLMKAFLGYGAQMSQ